jgi:cytochrome c peroxidase
MTKLFPVNRVVLILHAAFVVATAAAVFVAALQGSLPHAWQPNVALAATVLGGLAAASATTIKFLDGSQKSEALQAAAPVAEPYLEQPDYLPEHALSPVQPLRPEPTPDAPAESAQ